MADISTLLSDFVSKTKGTGANDLANRKSNVLPPTVAPGLFSSIAGGNDQQGNYGTLNLIGQRIQEARANADADAAAKAAREQQKKIMDMIKKIQQQANAAARASAPRVTSPYNGSGSIGGGGGTSPLPKLNPPTPGGGGIHLPDVTGGKVSPPVVAPPAWHYCRVPPFNIPVPCW